MTGRNGWDAEVTIRRPLREELPVVRRGQQGVRLGGVVHADTDEPAVAVGILVHGLGLVDHLLVDLEHLAGERRDDVRDGFHGLDFAVRRVPRDPRAFLRRLEVHELAERVRGEPGDPERRLVAVDPRPVVLAVVAQIVGIALSAATSCLLSLV